MKCKLVKEGSELEDHDREKYKRWPMVISMMVKTFL